MNFISVLGALTTILIAGYAVLLFLEPEGSKESVVARLAVAWLLGTGLVSLLLWLFGVCASGLWLPGTVAATCLALAFGARKIRGRKPIPDFRSVRPIGSTELVLGVLLVAEITLIFYLCCAHTLGGDGLLNWEIKARYAYLNGGALPAAYFQDAGRSLNHLDYPLAIPYTQLWLYLWLGAPSQFWARAIFPVFYVAGVILLLALGTKLTGKLSAALMTSILLFFVPQISVGGGSATVGYADFPLSVFYLATIGYLLCACQSRDDGSFWIYAGCLALLPWVKREGTILWLVALLCGALVVWRTRRPLSHLLALVPGAFVIAGWNFYLWKMQTIASSDFVPVNFANLAQNAHRLVPILTAFLAEIVNANAWSVFWLMIAIGGVYFVRRFRDVRSIVLLVAVLGPICLYISMYIFSDWPDYHRHMGLSVTRLFMQVAPVASLTLTVALAETCLGRSISRATELKRAEGPATLIHTNACQS